MSLVPGVDVSNSDEIILIHLNAKNPRTFYTYTTHC